MRKVGQKRASEDYIISVRFIFSAPAPFVSPFLSLFDGISFLRSRIRISFHITYNIIYIFIYVTSPARAITTMNIIKFSGNLY